MYIIIMSSKQKQIKKQTKLTKKNCINIYKKMFNLEKRYIKIKKSTVKKMNKLKDEYINKIKKFNISYKKNIQKFKQLDDCEEYLDELVKEQEIEFNNKDSLTLKCLQELLSESEERNIRSVFDN